MKSDGEKAGMKVSLYGKKRKIKTPGKENLFPGVFMVLRLRFEYA